MRDSGGTVSGLRCPGAFHCNVITTYMYAMRLMSSAILPVHAYAVLVCLLLLQEATMLPGTDQTVLVALLRLFLPLTLTATTMTWLL